MHDYDYCIIMFYVFSDLNLQQLTVEPLQIYSVDEEGELSYTYHQTASQHSDAELKLYNSSTGKPIYYIAFLMKAGTGKGNLTLVSTVRTKVSELLTVTVVRVPFLLLLGSPKVFLIMTLVLLFRPPRTIMQM
jgi:hypothetical protein